MQAQQAVRGDLSSYSRAIVLSTLAAGLLLMAGVPCAFPDVDQVT